MLSIEPGFIKDHWESINPIIIMNQDEILSRDEAPRELGAQGNKKICIVAHNGFEGEFEEIKKNINNFDKEYQIIETSNRKEGGFFPLVKYYNGIDFIIAGAGYNMFYETRFFNKPAKLFPLARKNEDMEWRIKSNSNYIFKKNGADELIEIIQNL